MSTWSHYIELCQQFEGSVNGGKSLYHLSPQQWDGASGSPCFTAGHWYFSSKKRIKVLWSILLSTQLKYFVLPLLTLWSMIHVTIKSQKPGLNDKREVKCSVSKFSLIPFHYLSYCLFCFLSGQTIARCIQHLSWDSTVVKLFFFLNNKMPVRWQIRFLSHLSVISCAPWKLEVWIQSTWQFSRSLP